MDDRADGSAGEADRISFLGTACPRSFRLRTLTLRPDEVLEYRQDDWADTFVVVERGELELRCRGGTWARFGAGAMLTLAELGVLRLRNAGTEPLVLSALSRR